MVDQATFGIYTKLPYLFQLTWWDKHDVLQYIPLPRKLIYSFNKGGNDGFGIHFYRFAGRTKHYTFPNLGPPGGNQSSRVKKNLFFKNII